MAEVEIKNASELNKMVFCIITIPGQMIFSVKRKSSKYIEKLKIKKPVQRVYLCVTTSPEYVRLLRQGLLKAPVTDQYKERRKTEQGGVVW